MISGDTVAAAAATAFPSGAKLIECHGHIIADGIDYKAAQARHRDAPDDDYIRATLKVLQENGIVYYRDGGDKLGVSARAKILAPEYGIEYRTPVAILHRRGYYGGLYGFAYENLREYARRVADVKRQGADFIKIAVSGMLDFAGDGSVMGEALPLSEIRELVHIASDEGFRVMAHVSGAENIKNALIAGVSSVEHGFWADNDALALLNETGAVFVPTCAPVENLIGSGRFPDATLRKILSQHYINVLEAARLGAAIACGSDCGALCVPQGKGTRDEQNILDSMGVDTTRGNEKIQSVFKRL
jgi:imidazolonepropionase-like amidohydrolase